MASLTLTKVSGVTFIKKDVWANPKSYQGYNSNYQASDDNTTVFITISNGATIDTYTIPYGGLIVGSQTATSMSTALVLLNAFFGT